MPYIEKNVRKLHSDTIEHFSALHAGHITAGELNYLLTSLCHAVIERQGLNYSKANEIMGVLECVKMELYRTVISDYEDVKRKLNGNISELDKNDLPKLS